MSSDPTLTELEGAALALVAREQALTAYEIKEWFRRSPSSYWSGSAGAVYPLMKRLETAGLVAGTDESRSNRPRRVFRLTAPGEAALQAWLSDAERAADAGHDPLRTRLAFVAQMPPDKAKALLHEVLQRYEGQTSPSDAAGTIAVHKSWLEMRRTWIREWLARLD